jgi:hypothetical protein
MKVSALVRSSFHGQHLTSDLRTAVRRRVRETGLPSFGHSSPFIFDPKLAFAAAGQTGKLDFKVFVAVIILDRNSQICFHKIMLTKAKTISIVHDVIYGQS